MQDLYILVLFIVVMLLIIACVQFIRNIFNRNEQRVQAVISTVTTLSEKDPIIISLTTSPRRLPMCLSNLAKMLEDGCIPDEAIIELNLPRTFGRTGEVYPPIDYTSLHPKIKVYSNFEDEGPATKVLPTLDRARSQYKHGLVISIDDDIYYERGVFDLHKYFYYLYEGKVTTCFHDLFNGFDFTTYFNQYLTNIRDQLTVSLVHLELRPSLVPHKQTFFVEGFGSVGYPLHLVDPQQVRTYLRNEPKCRNSDDLLLSLALKELQVPIIKMSLDEVYHAMKLIRILDYGLEGDALHNLQSHHEKYSICLDRLNKITETS